MFTGIIQAVGQIERLDARGGDARLSIVAGDLPLSDVAIGDSIAVNGVCLTVVARTAASFSADVSAESLARTTLGRLRAGSRVNLEKALAVGDRLGGHIVSGHVDGIATLQAREPVARSVRFRLTVPPTLAKYVAAKGSVCLDGVSLTVNAVAGVEFDVNIVPHTLAATTLGDWQVGSEINLEVDLIARYLERLVLGDAAADATTRVTEDLLVRAGFIRR